jgi:tetratricopeptide (TPR) repeat protein
MEVTMCILRQVASCCWIVLAMLILAWGGCQQKVDDGKIPITTVSSEARQEMIKGRDLFERVKVQESIQHFEAAIAKDKDFALGHYYLALVATTTQQYLDAIKNAVALSGKVSEGERLMIMALDAGTTGEAVKTGECMEKLVAAYPKDERAHNLLAGYYYGQQRYEKAIDQYKKAVDIAPNFPPSYNTLGYAYSFLGKYDDAEKAFKKYTELIPDDPNPPDSYGELLLKMGKFNESIAAYRRALAIDPRFMSSHLGIASSLLYIGKPDDALAELDQIYEKGRNQAERSSALLAKAMLYVDQGKTALALAELNKDFSMWDSIKDIGSLASNLSLKAEIMLELGKPAEAQELFDRSMKYIEESNFDPAMKDNARLGHRYDVARVALPKKDLTTAHAEADQFLRGAEAKQNPGMIRQAHQLAGMIAFQEKEYAKALAEFQKANQLNPYNLYRMALTYKAIGDRVKAKEYCEKAAHFNVVLNWPYAFVRKTALNMLAQL